MLRRPRSGEWMLRVHGMTQGIAGQAHNDQTQPLSMQRHLMEQSVLLGDIEAANQSKQETTR